MADTYGARWSRSVEAVRAAAGLSQDEAAGLLGMARPTLNRKIKGSQDWTAKDMEAVRRVFGERAGMLVDDLRVITDNRQYLSVGDPYETRPGHVA